MMKKLLMIAIAALALTACDQKDKYDVALDEYETLIDETIEAIKNGDEKAAAALDRKLADLAPTMQEVEEQGSDGQRERMQLIAAKFGQALFGVLGDEEINETVEADGDAPQE